MPNEQPRAIFSVYIAQNGASMSLFLDQDENDKLYEAVVNAGAPVAVWQASGTSSTGLVVVPAQGGVTYHAETAQPHPVDETGRMLSGADIAAGAKIVNYMPVEQLPRGRVFVPPWSAAQAGVPGTLASIERLLLAAGVALQSRAKADTGWTGGNAVAPPAPPPAPPGAGQAGPENGT